MVVHRMTLSRVIHTLLFMHAKVFLRFICAMPIVCASVQKPPKEAQAEREMNFTDQGSDDMASR